ncbi:MAG: hypothetical protein R3E08_07435 [Thiotrichaceae bacterium]
MENIVIVAAARTPIGSFNGMLADIPASDLVQVIMELAGHVPN